MNAQDFKTGKQFINKETGEIIEVMNFGEGNVFMSMDKDTLPLSEVENDLYISRWACFRCKSDELITYHDTPVFEDNKLVFHVEKYGCKNCGFKSSNLKDFDNKINMNRNFKVEKSGDNFVKVIWELKSTINEPCLWSEIKGSPLLNDLNKPIGVLNDFALDTGNNRFDIVLIFTVWKEFAISSFKDIEMIMLDSGEFEFRMI